MSAGRWSNQEQYEALHGTQEEQARKQSSIGVTVGTDGPWRLVREDLVLPNSVRSTRNEIERLQEEERTRTGFLWQIEKFTRD